MNLRRAILGVLGQHWRLIAVLIVLAALGVQSMRLGRSERALAAVERDLVAFRARVEQAGKSARAMATAEKIRKEAEYAKAALSAQADYDALRQRYAGLVRDKAAGGSPRRPDLPRAAGAAPLPEKAAAGAGVPFGAILIPQSDALICAENTAYAHSAHGWAMSIQQEDFDGD